MTNSSAQQDTLSLNTPARALYCDRVIVPEPLWQRAAPRHRHLSRAQKHWLFDPSSLTKKLIAYSAGQLRVEVIDQRIRRARFSEYKALKLKHHHYVVVREVILHGNQTALVYARTIMPLSTLKGSLRRLYYLGNRPLGSALFADPSMRRGELDVASIDQNFLPKRVFDSLPQALGGSHRKDIKNYCWGRRSVFFVKRKPLLVCEIFLPELIDT